MARPYWFGHIQISLVSFAVSFFSATETTSEIAFHQIDRKTGALLLGYYQDDKLIYAGRTGT